MRPDRHGYNILKNVEHCMTQTLSFSLFPLFVVVAAVFVVVAADAANPNCNEIGTIYDACNDINSSVSYSDCMVCISKVFDKS